MRIVTINQELEIRLVASCYLLVPASKGGF